MRYHVEYFDRKPKPEPMPCPPVPQSYVIECSEKRIGGHVVEAKDMGEALKKASINIECVLRPQQYKVTVTQLEG